MDTAYKASTLSPVQEPQQPVIQCQFSEQQQDAAGLSQEQGQNCRMQILHSEAARRARHRDMPSVAPCDRCGKIRPGSQASSHSKRSELQNQLRTIIIHADGFAQTRQTLVKLFNLLVQIIQRQGVIFQLIQMFGAMQTEVTNDQSTVQ